MSDKSISAPAPKADLSPTQQNDLSAHTIATKFLNDISTAMKSNDFGADEEAHNLITDLQGDPLQKQTLNQIASDMADTKLMQSLGLTASVDRDAKGDVSSLNFSSQDAMNDYQNSLVKLETSGLTPTQAESEIYAHSLFSQDHYKGQMSIDVNDPTRFVSVG